MYKKKFSSWQWAVSRTKPSFVMYDIYFNCFLSLFSLKFWFNLLCPFEKQPIIKPIIWIEYLAGIRGKMQFKVQGLNIRILSSKFFFYRNIGFANETFINCKAIFLFVFIPLFNFIPFITFYPPYNLSLLSSKYLLSSLLSSILSLHLFFPFSMYPFI